jgi:hypothetical protein
VAPDLANRELELFYNAAGKISMPDDNLDELISIAELSLGNSFND